MLDFPPLGEGEIDIPAILTDLEHSGFAGPMSMEIEFVDYEYPDWEALGATCRRKDLEAGRGQVSLRKAFATVNCSARFSAANIRL